MLSAHLTFTETEIADLIIIIDNFDNDDLDVDKDNVLSIKDKLQKANSIMHGSAVAVSNRIDNQIYQVVKAEFGNSHSMHGHTVQRLIECYNEHGQHKIDFSKIYDLED